MSKFFAYILLLVIADHARATEFYPQLDNSFLAETCPAYFASDGQEKALLEKWQSKAQKNYYALRAGSNLATMFLDAGLFVVAASALHAYRVYTFHPQPPQGEARAQERPTFCGSLAVFSGLFFSPFLITQLVGERVGRHFNDVAAYLGSFWGSESKDPAKNTYVSLLTLHFGFQCQRSSMRPAIREYFEKAFQGIEAVTFNKRGELLEGYDETIASFKKGIVVALSLPFSKADIHIDDTVSSALEAALSGYDHIVKDELIKKAVELAIQSHFLQKDGVDEKIFSKPVLYFQGAPGTGKTTLARKFAKALDLLLVEIPIHDLVVDSGEDRSAGANPFYSLSAFKRPSAYTAAFLKARNLLEKDNYKGILFFFDEIDKVINGNQHLGEVMQQILALLDPKTRSLYLPDLGLEFDISSSLFVLAGNAPLESQAITERMKTLLFPPLSAESKHRIAQAEFEQELKVYDLVVGESEYAMLEKIIESDKNPGVRTLLSVVKDYVNYLKLKSVVGEYFPWHKQSEEFDFVYALESFNG